MAKFETYDYQIDTHFASAIINGDYTGLEDQDEAQLEAFLDDEPFLSIGHWDVDSDEMDSPDFRCCEVSGLMGSVATFKYHKLIG